MNLLMIFSRVIILSCFGADKEFEMPLCEIEIEILKIQSY